MNSQLTSIAAAEQRADLLAAADRSRRTTGAARRVRSERPSRRWLQLRRRPATA
ncbi:MAG: hypothetical protein QOC68_1953 [Solirubrobacteraceae bacterium]|jgi:hypothetical protein|nr:hypothetical protein [Solirubrobacteraceae bacterium]